MSFWHHNDFIFASCVRWAVSRENVAQSTHRQPAYQLSAAANFDDLFKFGDRRQIT